MKNNIFSENTELVKAILDFDEPFTKEDLYAYFEAKSDISKEFISNTIDDLLSNGNITTISVYDSKNNIPIKGMYATPSYRKKAITEDINLKLDEMGLFGNDRIIASKVLYKLLEDNTIIYRLPKLKINSEKVK